MSLRTRKLVGSVAMMLWLIVFALGAMAIIGAWTDAARPHFLIELLIYVVLGFGWILPLKPLFIWMGKGS